MNRMMVLTVSAAWVLGAVGAAPLTLAADRAYVAALGHTPRADE